MNKYNRIMEKVWLVLGVATTIMVTYAVFEQGWDKWKMYYIFPGLAFLMWWGRSFSRKRLSKMAENDNEKGGQPEQNSPSKKDS